MKLILTLPVENTVMLGLPAKACAAHPPPHTHTGTQHTHGHTRPPRAQECLAVRAMCGTWPTHPPAIGSMKANEDAIVTLSSSTTGDWPCCAACQCMSRRHREAMCVENTYHTDTTLKVLFDSLNRKE